MKKRFSLAILPLFAIALASCGDSKEAEKPSTSITTTVEATTTKEEKGTTTTEEVDETKMEFTVTVVQPDGTPMEGVQVQWCSTSGNCFSPKTTDASGVATISLDKELSYEVHIIKGLQSYGYNRYELLMNKDNASGTVHLFTLNQLTGEGTTASPYVLAAGNYKVMLEADKVYEFVLPCEEGKEYTLEAYADFSTVLNDYGFDGTKVASDNGKGGAGGKNFKYTFTATGVTDKPRAFKMLAKSEEIFYFTVSVK